MPIKYWEFEDAPMREKLKDPSIKDIAKIYFENDTKAYRFATVLCKVKKSKELHLKDCGPELPLATWKRYLDFGVMVGILKHENGTYSFTDRYSKPLKNVSTFIKSWMETQKDEDPTLLFAAANTGRQQRRGGRTTEQTKTIESTESKQE